MTTVSDAAKTLGVTRARVLKFITEGRLPAQRDSLTGWYLIEATALKSFEKIPRKPGRKPKKSA